MTESNGYFHLARKMSCPRSRSLAPKNGARRNTRKKLLWNSVVKENSVIDWVLRQRRSNVVRRHGVFPPISAPWRSYLCVFKRRSTKKTKRKRQKKEKNPCPSPGNREQGCDGFCRAHASSFPIFEFCYRFSCSFTEFKRRLTSPGQRRECRGTRKPT